MTIRIADRWYERNTVGDGVTLLWEPFVDELLRCNIWHVRGRDRDLFVDTGLGIASLVDATRDLVDRPVAALATHVHVDHIGNHHEFADCLAHRLEAAGLEHPRPSSSLITAAFDPRDLSTIVIPGYPTSGPMITALPHAGYNVSAFRVRGAKVSRRLEDGDVVDLGDRQFEVLHLPGHSPGSIGLLEQATGILFSGDALYDGQLIDGYHHSDVGDYVRTMHRLRQLDVRVVHAGHCPSFGRQRLIDLVDAYLASRT